jgi:hypothetical protein
MVEPAESWRYGFHGEIGFMNWCDRYVLGRCPAENMQNFTPPFDAKIAFLVASIVAALLGAVFLYQAARNELTGRASVRYVDKSRWGHREIVTREDAPEDFRTTTNFIWGKALCSMVGAAFCFVLYRKLDDCA